MYFLYKNYNKNKQFFFILFVKLKFINIKKKISNLIYSILIFNLFKLLLF